MARYTTIEALKDTAKHSDEGYARVWLRDCGNWLRVTYYEGELDPTYYIDGQDTPAPEVIDLFNLEMRVYGWVTTDRTA